MKKLVLLLSLLAFAVPASAGHLPILAAQDLWPVYAPDGTHVAYTELQNPAGRVFDLDVVDLATHKSVQIARSAYQPSPTWSSDGRIAWSSGGILYTANADGTGRKRYVAPTPAYSPAWQPHTELLAYVTHHGAQNLDLWVGSTLWATDVIGKPAWSQNGVGLAFDREDGVYVTTGPNAERRVAAVSSPGGLAWSYEDNNLAYLLRGAVYVVDPIHGGASALKIAHTPTNALAPSWSEWDVRLSADRAWSRTQADSFVLSGPKPGCPGHLVLLVDGETPVTGTCTITGTSGNDVIEGTQSWGDVILGGAGNDQIHAGDRHTDRIDCGPGRDTVWADKVDKLAHCEIVHR